MAEAEWIMTIAEEITIETKTKKELIELLKRAAELLQAAYEQVGVTAWEESCDQWLKDAGMEEK
jgi:hypothetical protein